MNIKERITTFITSKGLTIKEFEKKCNIGNGTIAKLSEKSRISTLKKIGVFYPELNIEWVKTGNGEMILEIPKNNAALIPETITIPVNIIVDYQKQISELIAQTSNLIKQNGDLLKLLKTHHLTVPEEAAGCADVSGSDLER